MDNTYITVDNSDIAPVVVISGSEPSPVVIKVNEFIAPVTSVNGKIGAVDINKSDVDLNFVENISILEVSGSLSDRISVLESGSINFTFNFPLSSGEDIQFIAYPSPLENIPSSISYFLQNNIDDFIYGTSLGSISTSGFYVNFSEILYSDSYILKAEVKL